MYEPYFYCNDDEPPYCENGCGELAEVKLTEACLCGDCAGRLLGDAMQPLLGYRPCGRIVWQQEGEDEAGRPCQTAVCLVPFGTEHPH